MANYNVDIQVGIKGTGALDRFTKTVNALAEKTELVNKNFSKGIQNIARYEQNLNRTARTLKLARTGQQQETIAIKNFVKALGEANTARERQERLIKKEIATQNAAKRVTSAGPTGFSRAQFGPALPPAMVKRQERLVGLSKTLKELQAISEDIAINRLNIANKRIESERRFNQESEEGNRIARQKTAEFLKQQRLLLQMSRQYSEPIGPAASGVNEFRRDRARRQRAQFIASGAPGVPVAGAQQALPAFRERGLQILDNSVKLNESQLRIEAALNGERQRGVRFLEAQSREEKRQLDLGITGQRSNLIPGVSSGKAVPRTQYPRPIGPQPAGAGRGMAGGSGRNAQNLALGIGFPLLFGGGVGSVAGGALGSVGGMGGQVLGSAIGGIVDQAAASIAELGKALNPFTADVKAVTAAAGESSTAFERLIVELEEVAGKEKALEVATAQLATIIGSEGVDALKEFGDASSDLSNELSKALTALGAALAPVLADIARATASAIERSRLLRKGSNELKDDPRVQQIRRDLSERKIGELEAEDRIAKLIREKELEEQIGIAKQAQADIQAKIDEKTSSSIVLKEQELVIAQNGGDILNEQVQTALQNIDAEKIRLKILEAQGDPLKLNLAYMEAQLLSVRRTNKIEQEREARQRKEQREAEAAQRKVEAAQRRAAREAEQEERKKQQLATGLLGEYISQVGIISQIRQLGKTELVQLDEQRSALELIYAARVKQVEIATEDASLESARLETLKQQREFEIARLDRAKEQLRLAKDLAELSAGAGFDVSAPFERNMKFVGGKSVLDTGPASFEEGIDLAPLIEYEVQLDRILEKYPMIGEAATAAAGLVTFGVQEMIDGTKSAEQVFADFLNNIADMLMKTAQQMIAQYIAIAIAKMFAGMGSAPQASDFNLSGFGGLSAGGASGTKGFLFGANNPLKFADGGRPPVGRPSIVGERGPELFVPGASGTIIPNEAMGGVNVGTINITVENTGEQLNPAAQKQLAGQVQGIVLSTLANERRSGGML